MSEALRLRNAKKHRKDQSYTMYTENDFMTPRDRVNESLMRRALTNSSERVPPAVERKSWGLEEYPLASVYAPLQCWRNLYDNETGFSRGTIFKELDLPFLCSDKSGGNCYGR